MLRIEGNRSGRWIARFAVAAAMALCVANPATARRQGVTTWTVQGPQGGPFTPTSGSVKITNNYSAKLRWWATGDTSWVDVQNTGIVLPGQSKTVSVALIETVAAQKSKGTYKAQIAFRDPSTGAFSGVADLFLVVGDPPTSSGQLVVTPPEGLSSSGNQGGTFSPSSKTYTLQNTGSGALSWRVSFDDSWVSSPDATVGQLQPGASTTFDVQLDGSQLGGFAVGQYASHVHFWDAGTNLEVATRDVNVEVKTGSSGGAGWTQFNPSPDTRKVYVSSSQGNDANNGLSEASPKKSISAGKALLRNNYPDWLLLKKGDTWNEDLGVWSLSGRSLTERMLVTSYGTGARPTVRPVAGNNGLSVWDPYKPEYVALVDLHITPQTSPTDGRAIAWYSDGGNFLVEGCLMENFDIAFLFQAGHNITVRRSVAYNNDGQGGYIQNVKGFLFEENVVDKSGFPDPNYYKHALYIDNEGMTGVVVRKNIFTEASSNGIYLRPGGTCEDNLVARCGISIELGGGDSWFANPGGVTAVVRNNVVLDGKDINATEKRGWGMLMQNIASATIENNIIANIGSCGFPFAIEIDGWSNGATIHDVTLRNNISYGWKGEAVRIKGNAGSQLDNLAIDHNDFQNEVDVDSLVYTWDTSSATEIDSSYNRFHSIAPANAQFTLGGSTTSLSQYKTAVGDTTSTIVQVSYPYAGSATIAGYHASLGKTASHEAFMTEARKQSKDNWRPEYTASEVNNWIRAGFGK
jgi:Right handed beta helix region